MGKVTSLKEDIYRRQGRNNPSKLKPSSWIWISTLMSRGQVLDRSRHHLVCGQLEARRHWNRSNGIISINRIHSLSEPVGSYDTSTRLTEQRSQCVADYVRRPRPRKERNRRARRQEYRHADFVGTSRFTTLGSALGA